MNLLASVEETNGQTTGNNVRVLFAALRQWLAAFILEDASINCGIIYKKSRTHRAETSWTSGHMMLAEEE